MNSKRLFYCGGLLLLLAVLMTSCHGMWDEEGQDCTTYKRIYFTYNWNMLFADAFPHEVKTLTLYAFNPDGSLAYQKKVSADSVISKGYMDASDMPSGVYTFQVWAEGEDRYPGSYIFGTPNTGTDARTGLTAAITEVASSVGNDSVVANTTTPVNHDLTPLYYGASGKYGTPASSDFTDMPLGGTRSVTINLMKETENFRIVLADESGQPVDPSAFTFTITDANGAMDADNNLVGNDTLSYHAWSVQQGDAGEADTLHTGAITGLSSVVAELTTNRLVADHSRSMRLHVTRTSDGKEIINLPLIDVCLLVKGNYNRDMDNQEYLDRQDTWNLIFFISRENNQQYNWLAASIYVQQWRVVLQDVDM